MTKESCSFSLNFWIFNWVPREELMCTLCMWPQRDSSNDILRYFRFMRPRSTLLICINGCKDRLCCWVAAGRNRRSWCPSLIACKEDMRMCLRTCQSDSVLPSGYNFAQSRHKPHATMITCLPNSDMWLDCAHNLEMFGLIVLTQFVIMSKNMDI